MKPDELDKIKDHLGNHAGFYIAWFTWSALAGYIAVLAGVHGSQWSDIIAPICVGPGALVGSNQSIAWLRSGKERKQKRIATQQRKIAELERTTLGSY